MAMKLKRKKHALEKKAKNGFKGYPVGTVAFYGPDNKKATKIAAGIVLGENEEPFAMKKWFSEKEIRRQREVLDEVLSFFSEHGVRSVVMSPKILGCPHEEGIDYPDGEYCPECLFWKNKDRFTDETIH